MPKLSMRYVYGVFIVRAHTLQSFPTKNTHIRFDFIQSSIFFNYILMLSFFFFIIFFSFETISLLACYSTSNISQNCWGLHTKRIQISNMDNKKLTYIRFHVPPAVYYITFATMKHV